MDRQGRAFPHVYGPVEVEAVFEAAPYLPGIDGRFHPHEEAIGFAKAEAIPGEVAERALSTMGGFPAPWWIAGGWALDLFLDRKTRRHADLEISILRSTQLRLFERLDGWDLRLARPGHTLEIWDRGRIDPSNHQVWARNGPGRPSSPDAFAANPTMLEFLLEQERDDR
jgi:Aminoglycoside-2''-adenylyltransferase